jgi:uncharacterized protein
VKPPNPWETKLVRDPLHGFIGLTEREVRLAGTSNFLRLGRIHQLAHTHVVYPGAVHTRLEHSFGTLYVTGRIAEELGLDEKQRAAVRAAALLHDIGHGPYSHLFEGVMHSIGAGEFDHEAITRMIVASDPEVKGALGDLQPDVLHILEGKAGLLSHIISGGLDSDKLDYLRRDAHHTGVSYGVFDIERILRSACAVRSAGEEFLAVRWKGKDALENYRLARYSMHAQVYEHKTRLIADDMFVRAVALAIEEGGLPKDDLLSKDPGRFLPAYASLDDSSIELRILSECKGLAQPMMADLRNRRLLKEAYELPLTKASVSDSLKRKELAKLPKDEIAEIEREIAKGVDCPSDRIIVHPQVITIKLYERFDQWDEEEASSLLIERRDGSVTSMEDESPITAFPEPIRRIFVFAPREYCSRVNDLATRRFGFKGAYTPPISS